MEWYENLKRKYRVRMIQRYIDGSRQVYQIKEHDGELWITMNEALCIPCRMLNGEPIETLNKLRELYVEQLKSRL